MSTLRALVLSLPLVWAASLPSVFGAEFDDETQWMPLGGDPGFDARVRAMVFTEVGNLYCGGDFTSVDGVTANRVAMWDGSDWIPLGDGLNNRVHCLTYADGNLYAGGQFTRADGEPAINIAMWDGVSWSPLDTGPNGTVYALTSTSAGIFAGGQFDIVGGVAAENLALWDGEEWSSPGGGANGRINALAASGNTVYAGGNFTRIGGVLANRIASWNGTEWSALGSGVNQQVFALAASGTNLYAGGEFTQAGGLSSGNHIARWNGSVWSGLGTGVGLTVYSLAAFDNDLFAGMSRSLVQWNGSSWNQLGSGTNGIVRSLAADRLNLFTGGDFASAGGKLSPFAAQVITAFEAVIEIRDPNEELIASNSTITFTEVAIGSADAKLRLTIHNLGNTDLDIEGITISGEDIDSFIVDSDELASALPPGDTTSFAVTFLPTDATERTFDIGIGSNDPDTDSFVINFAGTGLTARQILEDEFEEAGLEDEDADIDAAPFGDGVENLLKYAFNMDLSGPDASTLAADGTSGLPRYSLISDGGELFFRFEFLRRKGSGLIYTPLKAADPAGTYEEAEGTETIEEIDYLWDRVLIDVPADPSTQPTCFGRVMVELPPDEES